MKTHFSTIAAVVLFAVAQPSLAADLRQFDLVCDGERVEGGEAEPIRFRLRADLDRREYCRADCEQTSAIQAISSRRIDFIRFDDLNGLDAASGPNAFAQFWVVRETGRFGRGVNFPGESFSESGFCRPAPFSGFPRRPDNLF